MQYKFKDSEIGRILRNLVVLVDTREQANDHIIQYFKDNKIAYKKQKLDYGDYSCMLPVGTFEGQTRDVFFTNDIVVEPKFCIDELAMNLKDKKTNINEVNQEIIDLLGKEYLQGGDVVDTLDISILQKHILDEILGIKNPRTDKRIDYECN